MDKVGNNKNSSETSIQGYFCTFSHQKTAFFTSFCTAHFDIQEITLTFTFQNGGTSREWC